MLIFAINVTLRESAELGAFRSLVVSTPLVRDLAPSFASWRGSPPPAIAAEALGQRD